MYEDMERYACGVVMQAGQLLRNTTYRPGIDTEIEQFIFENIHKQYPSHSFDGEELGLRKGDSEFTWYCDPISSTSNYKRGLPHFAVCLSLFRSDKPIVGIVLDPITNELFHANGMNKAYLNMTPLLPSKARPVDEMTYAASGSAYNADISTLRNTGASSKMFGSWSIHFCYVACGKLDFAATPIKDLHGTAAGLFIAESAGCHIRDNNGLPWSSESTSVIVAGSQETFNQLQSRKLFGTRETPC